MSKNLNAKKITSILLIITILFSLSVFIPTIVNAYDNNGENSISGDEKLEIKGFVSEEPLTRSQSSIMEHIRNNTFYIKNAFSGQYLDVDGGIANNGRNVQQYTYNGSDAQKWTMHYNGDDTFSIYSGLGNNFVLDIYDASSANAANVHIYTSNDSNAQKFKIGYTGTSCYVLLTKTSNYSKCVITYNRGCSIGDNVNQYTYGGNWNEAWILEPVSKDVDMGAQYSTDNYNNYVQCYPNLSNLGGDCTNFVSQCMLASGIHYQDGWGVYRRNGNYTDISSVAQLNDSWSLTDPSPWISAKEFRKYWVNHVSSAYKAKGSDIVANPSIVWNAPITEGCVVQIAYNILDSVGDAHHSMYINGYLNDGGTDTYLVTYHTSNTLSANLLDLCKRYSNEYFLFYVFK